MSQNSAFLTDIIDFFLGGGYNCNRESEIQFQNNEEGGERMKTGIHIIVGHYGSGKSEFCMNFAMKLRQEGVDVAVADLDIVNPYFRTRQQAQVLGAKGVHVVSSNFDNDWTIDLPALNSELQSFFLDNGRENLIDVGGNAVGARVLARFHDQIREGSYEMWLVVNANRYESQTADQVIEFAEGIARESRLTITGVINNTHMLDETTMEDIFRGDKVVREVCERLKVPCVYCSCPASLYEECKARDGELLGEVIVIDMYLRPDYLRTIT